MDLDVHPRLVVLRQVGAAVGELIEADVIERRDRIALGVGLEERRLAAGGVLARIDLDVRALVMPDAFGRLVW